MLYQLYYPSDAFYLEQLIKEANKLDIDWNDFKNQVKQIGNLDSFLDNPNLVISVIMNNLKEMLVKEIKDQLDISQELENEIIEELDKNTRINSYDSCLNTTEAFQSLKDKLYAQADAEIETGMMIDKTELKQIFDKYYIKENLSQKDVE